MTFYIIKYVRKFNHYYRKHGFFWLCRHISTNLVHYRKLIIIETVIKENYEKIEARITVNIRLLSESEKDIEGLMELHQIDDDVSTPEMIKNLIKERLVAGDRCMIAEYEGNIIHMNWIGFYDAHLYESFERKRGLEPGEALSHNTYCAKSYRNNGLMTAVRSEVFNFLANNNYVKLINYIDHDNDASVKVTKRFGGKPIGTIYDLKILGVNIGFLKRY